MSGLMNSADDVVECPLCMEPLEVDDLNFYPCTCGYQICRFCWHRIRTDENKLCPACRKEYPENPADFTPLTQEQMIAFKSQKRQRDQQRKQKITENRKHLANVRVVQKNLVFVVGLPPRLADADILKKHEYFGKYGKIHKVVINPSTTYAGLQGPSASAYVTYVHNCDALRAIQSVNNIMIDGRLIKTSLGTTKYCSHFMKNQQCPKSDCMYLHELGDPEASFTKEEMHQGKHQEYEKRLHDALIASAGVNTSNGICQSTAGNGGTITVGSAKTTASSSMSSSSSSTSTSSGSTAPAAALTTPGATNQQKEAWPSLSALPLNGKESVATANSNANGKNKKKIRSEKIRNEKNSKQKHKNSNHSNFNTTSNENHLPELSSDSYNSLLSLTPETIMATSTTKAEASDGNLYSDIRTEENTKEILLSSRMALNDISQQQHKQQKEKISSQINSDEEHHHLHEKKTTKLANYSSSITHRSQGELDIKRSLSASSNNSDDRSSRFSDSSMSDKSSPGSFHDSSNQTNSSNGGESYTPASVLEKTKSDEDQIDTSQNNDTSLPEPSTIISCSSSDDQEEISKLENDYQPKSELKNVVLSQEGACIRTELQLPNGPTDEDVLDATNEFSKLNMFDDSSNSFFSSAASFQQSLLLKNKLMAELRQNQINGATSSHLPDLLNEWEEPIKNVMMRNNKHVEEHLIQHHLQQQHQHQQLIQQQEEFLRMHESQKRNNLLNNIGLSQINGPHNDFSSNCNGSVDLSRLSYAALLQQQQQQQQHQHQLINQPQHLNDNLLGNNLFGANMSKFFDFHKNQQLHQQILNGHSELGGGVNVADSIRMASLIENNRANSQFVDNNLLTQQLQKQRLIGKFDSLSENQTHGAHQQQTSQQHNRISNQFTQNVIVDDDLGFDPFIETQKGLAELMENEVVQQQNTNVVNVNSETSKLLQHPPQVSQQQQQQQQQILDNMQRARMPPPGFSHINVFGFGGVRGQNSSKILPYMNMSSNGSNAQVGQQQPMPMSNNWNTHLAAFQQQQLSLHDAAQLQHQLNQNQSKRYGSNDWTAMDPAILSFRQYSSFPQSTQMSQPHQHQQQQDIFMQHLAQQQQAGQGFNSPNPMLGSMPPNIMPTNLLNVQQSSQGQVNASVQGMLEFLKNRQYV